MTADTDLVITASGDATGMAHVSTPGQIDISHGPILYVEGVSVSFDGFKALNDLTFTLDAGELRCVIGPNGAGKTRADSGRLFLGQSIDLSLLTEYEIARSGIGRKFQKPTVFESHTVAENLELAMKADKGVWATLFNHPSAAQLERVQEMLVRIRLTERADTLAGLLSHGQKQWLEIGMLLMQDPQILLLDEPVAGMTDEETERTAELLQSLAGRHTIVVVEHDMEFVSHIARTVTVLHEGRVLAEGSMDKIQNDERVIEVYLGR